MVRLSVIHLLPYKVISDWQLYSMTIRCSDVGFRPVQSPMYVMLNLVNETHVLIYTGEMGKKNPIPVKNEVCTRVVYSN